MPNSNRLNLDLVPVGRVDPNVTCGNCPSTCCRKGTVIPLKQSEVESLRNVGSELSPVEGRGAGIGRRFYRLLSDCGNLVTDPETGQTSCVAWNTTGYPKACREFPMGGYRCVQVQVARIRAGTDMIS